MSQFSVCCFNCCEEKGEAIFARLPGRASAEQVVHRGTPRVPVGAGSDKTRGSLRHGAPGLGWQQDWCGPVSEVAPEQPGDSLGTSVLHRGWGARCCLPAVPQFVWLCLCCALPGARGQEVDVTSNHPCSCGSEALALAEGPWCAGAPVAIVLCFGLYRLFSSRSVCWFPPSCII